MEEIVVSFGFGVALSNGVVFFAMILRAAIMSAPSRPRAKVVDPAWLLEGPSALAGWYLAQAVRGYDTPELFRDDTKARQQRVHERFLN